MARTLLPPGFRFHPTDVELILYYLKRKVMGKPFHFEAISEIKLYGFAPWDLPDKSFLRSRDLEWYFFCPRDRKYANGSKTNRATDIGFWKTTGKDRSIIHNSRTVGMKRTLIFHVGKAPRGDRTNWVMYEYRMEDDELVVAGFQQDSHVLCKIFQKSGMGPKIGEQYGALFSEDDWEDEDITMAVSVPSTSSRSAELLDTTLLKPDFKQSDVSGGDELHSNPCIPDNGIWLEQLAMFLNDSPLELENTNSELPNPTFLHDSGFEAYQADAVGIYDELEFLTTQAGEQPRQNFCNYGDTEHACQPMLSELGCEHYVELNDLSALDENDFSDMLLSNDLFSQHPLEHSSLFPFGHPSCDDDASFTTVCVANDPILVRPSTVDPVMESQMEVSEASACLLTVPPGAVDDCRCTNIP